MKATTLQIVSLATLITLVATMGVTALGPDNTQPRRTYLPIVLRPFTPTRTPQPSPTATPRPTETGVCQPIWGASYGTLHIEGSPSDPPAEQHADLNLVLRGYTVALGEYVGILPNCDSQPDDWKAPQLRRLFADRRVPTMTGVYWVYQWDWACNCRAAGVENRWGPSFATLATTPGEVLSVPDSGYCIDNSQNYEVLVLYASPERITLKYTREDNVLVGYTLHLEGICVDQQLVDLYRAANAAGRWNLPALHPGQAIGRARTGQLGFAIRDSGNWMDPRNCADWWRLP